MADPLTLTGSIGVFSIVPDAAAALEKLELGIGASKPVISLILEARCINLMRQKQHCCVLA